jgi:hypothetical protein
MATTNQLPLLHTNDDPPARSRIRSVMPQRYDNASGDLHVIFVSNGRPHQPTHEVGYGLAFE